MSVVAVLDKEFAKLHERSYQLAQAVPAEKLYWQPPESRDPFPVHSCGEYLLRSAASVEQMAGGITVNLWDDPFEWTLPETLTTPSRVIEYLNEVEAARQRCFQTFSSDDELLKEIMLPSGEATPLVELLTQTLVRAAHYQGCALATFRLFSTKQLPLA